MDCILITKIVWSLCCIATLGMSTAAAFKLLFRYSPASAALAAAIVSTLLPH